MNAGQDQYDVVIVGAGPAGSSTAIRLARSGMKVLLVEQKKFPRAKLCGEFISPECLSHFDELGVLGEMSIDAVSIGRTVFYARHGRCVIVPSDWFAVGSNALGLSRAEMDARLMDRARAVGVNVREETQAAGLIFEGEKVCGIRLRQTAGDSSDAHAALVIDATGRARILAREIDKKHASGRRRRADFVAFKAHLEGAAVTDGDCEIYAYRGGYGGCSRVEKELHNLCFIVSAGLAKKYRSDPGEIMRKVVFANRQAALSLENANVVGDWLAVPIENYGRAELAPADGLLSVGDAAAFIDPFTGSGILLALESAKILSGVIAAEHSKIACERSFSELAADYEYEYSSSFATRFRTSSFVRRAAFVPFLAELVIITLSASERMTRRLALATRPAGPP